MALTLPTKVRNAIADCVVDLLDAGTGAGKLKIGTTAMASTLVTLTYSDPAFGAAAAGVATASAITEGTAVAAGTAAEAIMTDSDDTDVITGLTVGTGSENVVLTSVGIAVDDVVRISSQTVTQPAS